MTFKACKYQCNTQIQWDTELSAFRESDGKLHDRKRCEGLRSNGSQQQQTQQVAKPESQQQNSSVRSDVWLIPKDDWDKLLSYIASMTTNIERLSVYYGDLLDHVKTMSRPIDNKEDAMAASEARYDQDKEDGLA